MIQHDTTMVVCLCHLDGFDIDLPILSLTGLSSSEPWPCAPCVAPLHLFTTWKHFFEQLQAFKSHWKILRSLNKSSVTYIHQSFINQVLSFSPTLPTTLRRKDSAFTTTTLESWRPSVLNIQLSQEIERERGRGRGGGGGGGGGGERGRERGRERERADFGKAQFQK